MMPFHCQRQRQRHHICSYCQMNHIDNEKETVQRKEVAGHSAQRSDHPWRRDDFHGAEYIEGRIAQSKRVHIKLDGFHLRRDEI
jgi:hypothetical protein